MQLVLEGEEVVVYMTMKQDIEDLQKTLLVANEYIEGLEVHSSFVKAYKAVEEPPLVEEEDPPYRKGSHWSQSERDALINIRNKNGIYDGMHIESIMDFFPRRTRAAVVSALWTKGIGVKKDRLKFKLIPSKIKGES